MNGPSLLTAAFACAGALALSAAARAAPANHPVDLPSGPDQAFNPLSSIVVSGSQSASAATLTVQLQDTSSYVQQGELSPDFTAYGGGFSLAVSTPLTKGADSTSLTTLSGLAGSTSISLQWSGFIGTGFQPYKITSEAAQAKCTALFQEYAAKWVPSQHGGKPAPKMVDDPLCEPADLTAVGVPDADRLALGGQPVSVFRFGGNVTVGEEAHTFYSPTTLAKSSTQLSPIQVGGYLTYIGASRYWAATLQVNYQRAYTDGPSRTACPSGPGPVTCVTGAFVRPTQTNKALIAGELRWFGTIGGLAIGVDPMATYDALSGAYAFAVPIYLFADGKDNLTGGVRVDWTSVKHRAVVGLFISKSFNIGEFTKPST